MKFFTAWEYLLIDVANQFGHDKKLFEERIQWALENLDTLEAQLPEADNKPLYLKAVQAIRKAQRGEPTGHLVGFDGVCSGIQIMSVLTGCIDGATSVGLVDPNVRADAYSALTTTMNKILTEKGLSVNIARADAKQALMTTFYGSKEIPKQIFGEDTIELQAFYQAAKTIAPGAWELLQDLLGSWQPYALEHSWKLPDGFDARVKVMSKVTKRIEVDELDHATFTYEFYENQGQEKGLANAANVVHSMDAYVLRSMHRRCNYDPQIVCDVLARMVNEVETRKIAGVTQVETPIWDEKFDYYLRQYERSGIADVVILPYINGYTVTHLPDRLLSKLIEICAGMLQYKPFPLITVHDEFKAHPNNINWLRYQYKEIMADIADSNVIDDLLSQVYQMPVKFQRTPNNLGELIRNSNYALT